MSNLAQNGLILIRCAFRFKRAVVEFFIIAVNHYSEIIENRNKKIFILTIKSTRQYTYKNNSY